MKSVNNSAQCDVNYLYRRLGFLDGVLAEPRKFRFPNQAYRNGYADGAAARNSVDRQVAQEALNTVEKQLLGEK